LRSLSFFPDMPVSRPQSPGVEPLARGAVTALLERARNGDAAAQAELVPLVYADLRRAAEHLLRRERKGHTLQPTDLVHEGFLKLVGTEASDAQTRRHYIAIAARAMRQVLVDHARRRGAGKRGAGRIEVRVTNADVGIDVDLSEIVALDDALERLGARNPRLLQVVELRFYAGLNEEEIAEMLGVTSRTVQRDWATARAWLYKELAAGQ
jgi:RNA polymerase sigma factor (TIGR02999 family)